MEWDLIIEDKTGKTRRIPLDHDHAKEQEAEREAENIADLEYTEDDVAWGLVLRNENKLVLDYMDDLEEYAEENDMSLDCASDFWPFEDWLVDQ